MRLLAPPGVGPWTAAYVAMRTLGELDALLATDLAVRRAAERLGRPSDSASLVASAERWRPWRSHAVAHPWASLAGGGAGAARGAQAAQPVVQKRWAPSRTMTPRRTPWPQAAQA